MSIDLWFVSSSCYFLVIDSINVDPTVWFYMLCLPSFGSSITLPFSSSAWRCWAWCRGWPCPSGKWWYFSACHPARAGREAFARLGFSRAASTLSHLPEAQRKHRFFSPCIQGVVHDDVWLLVLGLVQRCHAALPAGVLVDVILHCCVDGAGFGCDQVKR